MHKRLFIPGPVDVLDDVLQKWRHHRSVTERKTLLFYKEAYLKKCKSYGSQKKKLSRLHLQVQV